MPADRAPTFCPNQDQPKLDLGLTESIWQRLPGPYGRGADKLVESAVPGDLELIPDTETVWAELPYAIKHDRIRHLGNLMHRLVQLRLLMAHVG